MFNDTQSSEELLNEYRADLSDIQIQTIQFDKSDYVLQYLRKRQKLHQVVITKEFTSKRSNRYIGLMIYTQTGIGKTKNWSLTSYHIGLMDTWRGLCFIVFYNHNSQAIIFTTHFFERYKERCLSICDWRTRNELSAASTIVQIASIYLKRNILMTWIETKSVFNNKVHVFAPVNDGVALLQWDKKRRSLQANTFVTEDMLDQKQSEMVKYARIYISLPKAQKKKFRFPDFVTHNTANDDQQF